MKRIVLWAMSTLTVLVLLFGYHTSTSSRMAAAADSAAIAPISGGDPGTAGSVSATGSAGGTTGSASTSAGVAGSPSSGTSAGSASAASTVTGSVAQTRWGELPDTDFCLSAGGDLTCRTARPDAPPWRIGIEDPLDPTRVLAVVPIRTGAVATSGTAHRGSHLVDARTGRAPAAVASVTVIVDSLTWADIDATAAYALGPEAARWLSTRPDRTGLVAWRDGTSTIVGPVVGDPADPPDRLPHRAGPRRDHRRRAVHRRRRGRGHRFTDSRPPTPHEITVA